MDVSPFALHENAHFKIFDAYKKVRKETTAICQYLETEDYVIQGMSDVSPPLWHLMHTSWFFEVFLLKAFLKDYKFYNKDYLYLFNSYYQTQGKFFPRHQRGLLSRPTVNQALQYRNYIDQLMGELLSIAYDPKIIERTVLGIHHEQQHQELLLTDIKYNLFCNPLRPIYREFKPSPSSKSNKLTWIPIAGGLKPIGHASTGFSFDNELPQHNVYLKDYLIATRLITNGEYLEFIEAGGYQKPKFWLSDGWDNVQNQDWIAPLYWEKIENKWWHMTLGGMQLVDLNAPVSHVSYYEANAFANFKGKQLPTEQEWEIAAAITSIQGNFLEQQYLRPVASESDKLSQCYGDVWEWCQSNYLPYPGYVTPPEAFGEYNSKFMCNQMILRGGSCATPQDHVRLTYRNFFYPDKRWQFSGIRLVEHI